MSAVIYAAIVVMWAVVLVPMWLRRHDAATEARSVDKFSTAMRTLSRRTHGTPGRRYVVMPRRQPGTVSVHVTGAAVAASAPRAARPSLSSARAEMVRRRRRTTKILVGTVTFTALLAVAGLLPWLVQLLFDVVLLAFLVHLRMQARRTASDAHRRRRVPVAVARPAAAVAPAAAAPARRAPTVAEPAAVAASVDVSWTEELRAGSAFEVEVATDDSWQPVPVPPPTYTLKPPAPSTAAAYDDTEPVERTQPVAADEVPTELDEILERRWAVND